jgi:hypothetical protein
VQVALKLITFLIFGQVLKAVARQFFLLHQLVAVLVALDLMQAVTVAAVAVLDG